MKFTVQIWEQPAGLPVPADAAQACALPDAAAAHAGAWPNARLEAFRHQVLERFPISDERDWSQSDPAATRPVLGPWADDALRADLGDSPRLELHIGSGFQEVRGWLADNGPRAGVNVCDGDNAWLADGSVFVRGEPEACVLALARLKARDDQAAWEQLVELAARGNGEAVKQLARMYVDGRWVGNDTAISWAVRAWAEGWRLVDGVASLPEGKEAQHYPVLPHDRGQLDDAGRARADALLARLVDGQPLRAALLAAAHEFDARHVAALELVAAGQVDAAVLRLQPMATRGHRPSQRTLAGLWARGLARPDDPAHELAWTTALAELHDAPALVALARLYEEGVLCKHDTRGARGIHRLLVGSGETSAVRAASAIELKRLVGTPSRKFWEGRSEAELQPLADQGDVAALVELARLTEWGRSDLETYARSFPLWWRAAQAGDAQAQYVVAYSHEKGRAVDPDEEKATHWHGLAARNGHAQAQFEFAKRLDLGRGIARDRPQCVQWLEASARQRTLDALESLSRSFASGDMHPKDLVAAQVLTVLYERRLKSATDAWMGPEQADPREVRRLLAEIDSGADLVDVLRRHAQALAPRPPAAPSTAAGAPGLSLAPMAAARAPEPSPARERAPAPSRERAPAPAPAPVPSPDAARATPRPVLATQRRDAAAASEDDVPIAAPIRRSPLGPLLICASFGVLAIAVALLRKDAGARVLTPWLVGSALAAAGAYRLSRENGNPAAVAAMDAVPMFVPFLGSGLAARMLYYRWRGIDA